MRLQFLVPITLFFTIITVPYVIAERAAGTDYVFGGFLFNPIDGNTYLAKMYQGWRGDWRTTLPYTAEPGEGAYLFMYYVFLGHLARILDISLPLTYHLARFLGAIIMLAALYRFINNSKSGTPLSATLFSTMVGSPPSPYTYSRGGEIGEKELVLEEQRSGSYQPGLNSELLYPSGWLFILALFGSGMGWIVFLENRITTDFWVAEAYPFLSAYTSPHFVMGLALMLWLLIPASHRGKAIHKTIRGFLIFMGAFVLAVVSPFGVVLILAILTAQLVWELVEIFFTNRRQLKPSHAQEEPEGASFYLNRILERAIRLFLIFLGGVLVLLYDFWIVRVDPVLAGWNAQNLTWTPAIWDVLLSLSPAFLLSIIGVFWILNHKNRAGYLPLVWMGVCLLLVYFPFGLQRRFMMGVYVPVVASAGFGFIQIAQKSIRWGGLIPILVFILSVPTNLLILLAGMHGIQTHDPLFYLTRGEDQAFSWIEGNTSAHALILAAPQTGLFIPAHTGRRVIYGHPFETVDAEAEEGAVTSFYAENDPTASAVLLNEYQVDYVFYGPRERELGDIPAGLELVPVYAAEGVEIFQVAGE